MYTNTKLITISHSMRKRIFTSLLFLASASLCFASQRSFNHARTLQKEGNLDGAIAEYTICLTQEQDEKNLVDALVQLMNCYQSKGEPESCIEILEQIFIGSPLLRNEYLRDYNSVMGYALSRTERMQESEEHMLKALALPLYSPTPERYFRDYAYAAAVFYSNPNYKNEVINWCNKALEQAELCNNTSGKQWVTAMLGSIYKREGDLNRALELFLNSKEESRLRKDELGILNSLHNLVDLFIYWDIPEYADMYASEAINVEKNLKAKNPMVSAQTYINKGRALYQLDKLDSIPQYTEHAKILCESLPYNSGMVDVDILQGIYLTEQGIESSASGIEKLKNVTRYGTAANRIKAYHQLARIYLKNKDNLKAEIMLDSLYVLVNNNVSHPHILHIDYEPIISYYQKSRKQIKADQYINLLIKEQNMYHQNRISAGLVAAIVDFQTDKKVQDLRIKQLTQANHLMWLTIALATSLLIILILINLRRRYKTQIKEADKKLATLVEQLNESNQEKQLIRQEIQEFLKDKDKRLELETLTPHILKESGETKFRQCFELLYPLFLHRLREKVPSITRREEVLSMLIILKQDNKIIADLLGIAPRSVLMLRHRFRQKIGIETELSLDSFIEDLAGNIF
jgi:tetratricopeptide (TPR) repeat protein